MSDLLCFAMCRPLWDHTLPALMPIRTPLVTQAWESALSCPPRPSICPLYSRWPAEWVQDRFPTPISAEIGFQHRSQRRSATTNMVSARQHPDVVRRYIADERQKGRTLGPFAPGLYPSLHISRFGVIPKGHSTGKWRLITDLSIPNGHSVKDGIDPGLCTLAYTTVDVVAGIVAKLGKGSPLGKIDIEATYRHIPVHPQDRILQAVQWEGSVYVDTMLPFGLCSAPKIFNTVADALNWFLHQPGADTTWMTSSLCGATRLPCLF